MVIVTIDTCLNQLNKEVKDKIIEKQNEVVMENQLLSLDERLKSDQYRKKLLSHLSSIEQKYFFTFIKKYSFLDHSEKSREEQLASTEEKLALLLLQQKGLLFRVKSEKRSFILPIEVIDSYLALQFPEGTMSYQYDHQIITKKYIYYFIELVMFIKKRGSITINELKKFSQQKITKFNLEVILEYLEKEGLVKKNEESSFIVLDNRVDRYFKQSPYIIKQSFALFLMLYYLKNRFISIVLTTLLFRLKRIVKIEELREFVTKNSTIKTTVIDEVIEHLVNLNLVSRDDNLIIACNDVIEPREDVNGLVTGINEFLVPVYIDNVALWHFRCWGEFNHWEEMVHISFSQDTILNAIHSQQNFQQLVYYLEQFLNHNEVKALTELIEKWLVNKRPIVKKEELTFYSITEKLHLNFIEEHWPYWWDRSKTGIIISQHLANEFEKMLKKMSVTFINGRTQQEEIKEISVLEIENGYPETVDLFPEVESLPKQWFVLTSYDERMINRIIKQAIILGLHIHILKSNQQLVKLEPLKVGVEQGNYFVIDNENKKNYFNEISRVAILHPIELLM